MRLVLIKLTTLCLSKDTECVAGPTWWFQGGRSTLWPGWCDAHLGSHAPPPRARLGHLCQCGGLLAGLLVLTLGLRGRGGWWRLPAGRAAAGVHACVQFLLHLLQVLSSGPAAAHFLLCMLGPASSLGLVGGGGGCQRKHRKINRWFSKTMKSVGS